MHEDEIPVGRAKDLRGQVFGKLTVLYRVKSNNKKTRWKCLCECGSHSTPTADELKHGTKSCGCSKGKIYGNLIGQRFGRLICLYQVEEKCATGAQWMCQCDCGNKVIVSRNHLTQNHTQSCGCLQRERTSNSNCEKDLNGERFGKLTVIKEAYRKNYSVFWECLCDCGNTAFVSTGHLKSGHTKSCGCLVSQGEFKISTILNSHNIKFITQKNFNQCYDFETNETSRPFRFDFYVENSYLIEFDGPQHTQSIELFGGEEQLIIQIRRDQYKNQWCKDNNIPLIRIPYTKLDTLCIEDLLLETTKFRVV